MLVNEKRYCDKEVRDFSAGRGKPWRWKTCGAPATVANGRLDYCAKHGG